MSALSVATGEHRLEPVVNREWAIFGYERAGDTNPSFMGIVEAPSEYGAFLAALARRGWQGWAITAVGEVSE